MVNEKLAPALHITKNFVGIGKVKKDYRVSKKILQKTLKNKEEVT